MRIWIVFRVGGAMNQNSHFPQLPDEDEPMTWEATLDMLTIAKRSALKAHREALLPHGSIHVALAALDVQLAQAIELRRIAEALEEMRN